MITELDVNDVEIPGDEAARDAAVARHAAEYLDIVFSVARPRSISTWGLSDRATWMRQYFKRADGKPLRPLPLDRNLDRKPLWSVLAKYLCGRKRAVIPRFIKCDRSVSFFVTQGPARYAVDL
jgi:endo-1,4-beta-xylanase